VIHDALTRELDYQVHWKVIDARSWVPQHRERIFIIGFRERNNFSFDDFVIPDPFRGPLLGSILHPEDGSEPAEKPYTEKAEARVSRKYTLSDHLWEYLRDYADKHRAKGNGFGFGLFGPDDVARTLSARYYKDGSEILIRQRRRNPRRLTPRECARLMGFDKAGESPFIIPVSDTRAYKQFGNAVVVPVVEALARHMANGLTPPTQTKPHPRCGWRSMADVVEPAVRSRMMAGIRSVNTRPEIAVRHGLHRYGFRYRLHSRRLPGKPDIVLPRHRSVVLIHGCFWHGHNCHLFRWPASRRDFWKQKITGNRIHDTNVLAALSTAGWRVLVIWECALKGRARKPLDAVLAEAAAWIRTTKSPTHEIRGLPDGRG